VPTTSLGATTKSPEQPGCAGDWHGNAHVKPRSDDNKPGSASEKAGSTCNHSRVVSEKDHLDSHLCIYGFRYLCSYQIYAWNIWTSYRWWLETNPDSYEDDNRVNSVMQLEVKIE